MTAPQNVSRRYPHGLLSRGKNHYYTIVSLQQLIAATPGGVPVGCYFKATVERNVGFEQSSGEGLTPVDAIQRALVAAGVTFR